MNLERLIGDSRHRGSTQILQGAHEVTEERVHRAVIEIPTARRDLNAYHYKFYRRSATVQEWARALVKTFIPSPRISGARQNTRAETNESALSSKVVARLTTWLNTSFRP